MPNELKENLDVILPTPKHTLTMNLALEIIAGKDVTVIFEKMYDYSSSSGESDDGIEWVMYGKHIDIAKAKDINAYINIKQEDWRDEAVRKLFKKPSREKGNTFIRIIFADNGELPGKATIRFKPGFTLRCLVNEDDMRLYYLNEKSSSVDLVASNIKAEKTGYFHLNITHNSSYAFVGEYAGSSSENNGNSGISNGNVSSKSESTSKNESEVSSSQATEEINKSEVTNTSSSVTTIGSIPEKDSNALTIVLIILGAVILLGGSAFGYIYYKKKTAKAKENNISDAE